MLTLLVWHATVEPGAQVAFTAELVACCPGPRLDHVLAGEVTLRTEGPLRVVRAGTDGTPGPAGEVPPGTEVVLRPGDSATYRAEVSSAYTNAGSEPAHLASGGLFRGVPAVEPPGYKVNTFDYANPDVPLPPGAVILELGRATLAPEGVLAAPPTGALQVAVTEPGEGFFMTGSDGSVRNPGQETIIVDPLILRPTGSEAGTPEATPPA